VRYKTWHNEGLADEMEHVPQNLKIQQQPSVYGSSSTKRLNKMNQYLHGMLIIKRPSDADQGLISILYITHAELNISSP
jgi:hypothetical protein